MRYLNKIIFLNSAHTPFAEVKLDGNVHFIGTQGVGKSTLLRVLLFFYNADKLKLGIPKEMKSFDAFYFPFANSYIVYEVMRENGAYCIVCAKSQGRVFFRFVDAPFARAWFVNERNEVHHEWTRIREQIGTNVQITAQVTSYEMYRDIIFGNNRKQEMIPFRKFAIVESAKYQNIPRTIQNVFLNSKLDADFIKDTIIRSMSDEEVPIDLDYYRNQIKEFEQEYTDVMRWFTKNKNGEIPVRRMAEKVINAYRDLIYTQQQIREERAELNFAERHSREEIPQVKEEITRAKTEHERLLRLLGELQQKQTKERDGLMAEIGEMKGQLRQIQEKQAHYEQIGIEELTRRVARETLLAQELEQLNSLKNGLTKAYDDLLMKYRPLFDNLESDFRQTEHDLQARLLNKKRELAERKEERMSQLRAEEEKIGVAQQEKLQSIYLRMQQLRDEQARWTLKLQKIGYEQPHLKEITHCQEAMQELHKRDQELELGISRRQMDGNRLRQECVQQRKELEWECNTKREEMRTAQTAANKQIESLEQLIEKRKGSFCEWLERHKPDWQETIGRVADEEAVLYNQELHPRLVDDGSAWFGVSLDLSAIDRTIRTPEEIKQERDTLRATRQSLTEQLIRLADQSNEAISTLEKGYNKQLRSLAEEQHLMEAERKQIPFKRKNLQADLASWQTKEAEWKRLQREAVEANQTQTAHQLFVVTEEKKQATAAHEKLLKASRKNYTDALSGLERELEIIDKQVKEEIIRLQQQKEERKRELTQRQENELSGQGADTATIRTYDTQISEVKKELDYIQEHRPQVIYFERDRRELFDNESAFRNRKKELDAKLVALDERFAFKKEKHQVQLKSAEEKRDQLKQELQLLETGLEKVNRFREDETFSPPGSMEVAEKSTRKRCDTLVEELMSLIVSTIKKTDEFKKAITQFNGNFSAKNTFQFRTELVSEEDFYDFASNLCEFVDNDKISDFQKRISERYIDIIRRISKEVGDLTGNESEIHKTINAINNDFIERNFAGVIKEIALRALKSSDKLMQLLLEIKHFTHENQYNMGEVDLFSQASREEVNATAVRHLLSFMKLLLDDPSRKRLALADTFKLEFRVKENDNDTGWVEKVSNVGSDGTDILVKAMVNIMLINVFKEKASRKFGDFKIHCMMDEVGKLHPNNVKGILDFANCRNILLVNSSPTTYNAEDYRYTYLLSKDGHSNTQIIPLLKYRQADER